MGYFTDPIDDLMLGWRDFQEQHPDWFDKDHSVGVDSSSQASREKENNMSMKIAAGDTLTVGGLTRGHIGAEIEVGTLVDITHRFTLGGFNDDWHSQKELWTSKVRVGSFYPNAPVTVITPPPVVQPDEPTILGQCIRIEGDDDLQAVVADPGSDMSIVNHEAIWCSWEEVLDSAGNRQILVSDPPRWPDETPEVPEHSTVQVGPKAGDKFHRIEDMPDGWVAKVTLEDGSVWGYVVRHDDEYGVNHLWDDIGRYRKMFTSDWAGAGTGTVSGGGYGEVRYTLVETEVYHNVRVARDNA